MSVSLGDGRKRIKSLHMILRPVASVQSFYRVPLPVCIEFVRKLLQIGSAQPKENHYGNHSEELTVKRFLQIASH